MKAKISNIFWGVMLIVISGLLLAQTMGLVDFDLFSDQIWVVILWVASAAFFLSFFLNGVRSWGWLFPAFICAALAVTIGMALAGMDGSFLGTPILAAIAVPFFVGFGLERKRWGLLIPGSILLALSVVTLMADRTSGEWIGALVLFSIGLPFLAAYLLDRKRRWALIPSFILFVLALVVLLSGSAAGEWIGALVLYAIGLPFLMIYLADRSKRWALIPAAVMGLIGTIPLIAALTSEASSGVFVMLLFAAPFFVAYFVGKDNWWALIPAGVFASIAVVALLGVLFTNTGDTLSGLFSGMLMLGFALTFGVLWLRRKTQPTAWAIYPAGGLLAVALLSVLLGRNLAIYSPALVMLVAGIALLVTALVKRKPEAGGAGTEKPS